MSRYIPTKKNNPCPVCGDTKGKCRTFANSSTVLCMENGGIGKGAVLNGYYCIGDTNNGLWAKFVPEEERRDRQEQWSEEQRQEWIAKQKWLEEQRRDEELKRRQESLPVLERDLLYRQLLEELILHPQDRADLVRRGYSDEKIKADGYKSVEQWQRLTQEYATSLPGVNLNGRSLNIPFAGYLCPTRDESGYITGAQIRNRNPRAKEDGEPKYYWLTSKTRKRPGGPTPHLYLPNCDRDGELPLTVIRPTGTPTGIALVEGTGPKPNLASDRSQAIVIGAAGGLWDSSPTILKQTLDVLFQENLHLPKEVTLYPDGGDVAKYNCMVRDRRVHSLLTSWGYQVRIAWWGQVAEGRDIDELEDCSDIPTISWQEFWAIALEHCPELSRDNYPSKTKGFDRWQQWKQLENPRKVNQRYVQFPLEMGRINAIKSGLGTGKTQQISEHVKNWEDSIIFLSSHNAVLRQTAQRCEIKHLQTALGENQLAVSRSLRSGKSRYALCPDSLHHYNVEDTKGAMFVIDEAESVLEAIVRGKTAVARNRGEIKFKFTEALRQAAAVAVLDGHLSQPTIELLEELAGKPLSILVNEYRQNLTWLNHETKETFLARLRYAVAVGERCVISSDSQRELEALDRQLKIQGYKTKRIDSKTSQEPENRDLFDNPNKWFSNNPDIQIFLYSPSATAGFDVNILNHFKYLFVSIHGVLTVDKVLQLAHRVRDPAIERHLWIANSPVCKHNYPTNSDVPQEVLETYKQLQVEAWQRGSSISAFQLAEALTMGCNSPWSRYESYLIARDIFEQQHYKSCVLWLMRESHQVIEVAAPEDNKKNLQKALKQEKEALKDQTSEQIFAAADISTEEAELLSEGASRGDGLSWEDRCAVRRRQILDRLTEIEHSPSWSPAFVREIEFDNPGLVKARYLAYLLAHPDHSLEQLQTWCDRKWKDWLDAKQPPPLFMKHPDLAVAALKEIGIDWFLAPGRVWDKNTPQVRETYRLASSAKMRRWLGFDVRKQKSEVRAIGQIFKKVLGYAMESQQVRQDGQRIWRYRLAQLSQSVQAIDQAIELKILRNSLVKNEGAEEAQTHTTQALEGVTAKGGNLYNSPEVPVTATANQTVTFSIDEKASWASDLLADPPKPPEVKFCWQQLQRLEANDPSINSCDELVEVFAEVERQGVTAQPYLPTNFWNRFVEALGRVSVRVSAA